MLLTKLENAGHSMARLPGIQTDADDAPTHEAMEEGVEFIHQASLCKGEMRGSADLLKRIDRPSLLGKWSTIPIVCKLASKAKTTCAEASQTLECKAQGKSCFCNQVCQRPMIVQVAGNQSQPAFLRQTGTGVWMHAA